MTEKKPMRAELVDDYRIKCQLLLEEVIDAEEAAKLAAAEIAELRAERDRLAGDLKDRTGQLVDAIFNAKEAHAKAQTLGDEVALLTTERDRLAGEVEFVKGQLAGTNRNIAGWLQSRDDNLKRAEAAEAERDRLKAALEFYAAEAWDDDGVTSYATEELLKDKGFIARKALGDAS